MAVSRLLRVIPGLAALSLFSALCGAAPQAEVDVSPWGPKDEIGRLNLITEQSRAAIMARVSGSQAYDLAVEYFVGMPSWQAAGDPPYQMWMTHTPTAM